MPSATRSSTVRERLAPGEAPRARRLISDDQSLRVIARHFDLILEHCSGDDVVSGPGRPQERVNRYIAEMDPDLSIFVFKDRWNRRSSRADAL